MVIDMGLDFYFSLKKKKGQSHGNGNINMNANLSFGFQSVTSMLHVFYLLVIRARSEETGKSLSQPSRSITLFLQAQSRQTFHFLASLLVWLLSMLVIHCHAQNGVALTLRTILCN